MIVTKVAALLLVVGLIVGTLAGYVATFSLFQMQASKLQSDLSEALSEISDLNDSLSETMDEVSSLTGDIQDLEAETQRLEEELTKKTREHEEKIGELRLALARNVKINEVLYNPLGADDGNEWVELYNSGGSAVDLTEWTISGSDGSIKATLPSIILPPDCYLIIHFGPEEPGMHDTNFEDDSQAYFFAGNLKEVFYNDGDAVALYVGNPSVDTIVDYVAWSSKGTSLSALAENHASAAGIWTEGTFLDTSYQSGSFVMRGETIGRDCASADTDKSEDWDDNGGTDAWGPTEGRSNSGPLYTFDVSLFIVHFDLETVMWEYGFNVATVNVQNLQITTSEEKLLVTGDYEFMVEIQGETVPFKGTCKYNWWVVNATSFAVTVNISLTSDRGESFTLISQRYDSGIESQTYKWQRNLSATYVGLDGLPIPYSYEGTRTITQTAAEAFVLDDIRVVQGIDSIQRTAETTVTEIITSDTTSLFTLNAVTIPQVGDPELIHIETILEMDSDRQFNITIPVYTIQRGDYEFELLEPAAIEYKRVSGEPRDSFGRYQYNFTCTLGNPVLGFATVTVNLFEDYTKLDDKPIIRGEATASLEDYHIVTLKFYVYDWWRKMLRTGLRIVSGAAWAVGCFAGTVVGAPTCAGKFVAVGACAAGGVATDSLITDLTEEKKE
jgi:hypothetical protein